MDTCDGKLIALSNVGLFQISTKVYKYITKQLNPNPKTMLPYSRNEIYLGTNEGLYNLNLLANTVKKIPGISGNVTRLIRTREGTVYIATRDERLWKMTNDSTEYMGEEYLYEIFDIKEDYLGNIWLGTSSGLIKLKKELSGKFKKQVFTTSHGLLSNTINNLAITSQNIFGSTADGLFFIPLDASLINETPPRLFVNTFTCNGDTLRNYAGKLNFEYWQNSFQLKVDILSYKKNQRSLTLAYMLIGRDTSLRTHEGNTLVFDNLAPGNYKLVVNAFNCDGIKSLHTIKINFTIQKPYWATWWFRSVCVVALLTLLLFCMKIIITGVRRKEREKTRINKLIAESRLSALQAQMNPHFIFNAINSIQNYILKKEEKEAYNYLGKFSRLIRIVLTHSRQNTVSLAQELELIKLYVELEQLRFKYKFTFELQVDQTLNLSHTELPTMLIQPYVENAIWYGLMNLKQERSAMLTINVTQYVDVLKITIEDNGIGRIKAMEYKKESTVRSLGLKMIDERLEIINQVRGHEDVKVKILDLYDDAGKALGTKIELILKFE